MKPSPEIEAIVRRFVASRVDGPVADDLMSRSENMLVVGNAESHWYQGAEWFPILKAGDQALPVTEGEIRRIRAFESGNVGWAVWDESRTYENGPSVLLRRSLVFELEDHSWKIVLSHFSVTTPTEDLLGADLTRTLSELLESIQAEGESLRGMSGTATFVFTDIVDSTPLSLHLGERAWHAAITAHLDSISRIAEEAGGSVVKTLGDGGMFVFESGSAALRASVRMQQNLTTSSGPEMTMRVGVHTGDVVQADDDYIGSTVAKAARVAATAEGGQILVSSTTAGMVDSTEFEFGEPTATDLKGLDGSHELHPLLWS